MTNGNTPVNWRIGRIGEVLAFYCAGDPFLKLEYTSDGIPVLAKGDVKPFGRLRFGGERFVDASLVEMKRYRLTEPGDMILTTRDLTQAADFLGLVAPVPADTAFLVNQGANVIRLNANVDPRYFVYWCNSPVYRAYVKGCAVGSTQIHMRKGDFFDAPIFLPSLPEQRAIAHILGTLDDKIELNRRMNQTLEELARAFFHSWFVAFDPVRAKAAGRQPAGMDAATAALFPDAFAESELGEIPAGWHFGKVGDLVQIAKRTLDPTAYPEESFEHYSLPAFDAGRNPVVETGAAIKSNKTIVEPGAVLISKLNPHIPRVWLPELSSERRSICSTEFLVVGPNNLSARPFIYALFTSEPFTQAFASLVTGTTGSHQRVSPESLRAMPIVVPAEQVMLRFCRAMAPLFQDRARNRALSMTLATIRETLLPKLLSGEVRVGELGVNAAQAVGATA